MDTSNADQSGRVKDQDYYHINRRVPWSPHHGFLDVGDEIDVGGSSNPFFRWFETRQIVYPLSDDSGNVSEVPAVRFLEGVSSGEVNAPPDLANFSKDLAGHLARQLRELIWEDVRRREFPHLPSRQRCVWLIPNQDSVRFWLRKMKVDNDFQVLRVRVQGRLHTASESYLVADSMPLEEALRRARQYWLGIVEEAGTEEIIFEGRMRVEEVMPESFYV